MLIVVPKIISTYDESDAYIKTWLQIYLQFFFYFWFDLINVGEND